MIYNSPGSYLRAERKHRGWLQHEAAQVLDMRNLITYNWEFLTLIWWMIVEIFYRRTIKPLQDEWAWSIEKGFFLTGTWLRARSNRVWRLNITAHLREGIHRLEKPFPQLNAVYRRKGVPSLAYQEKKDLLGRKRTSSKLVLPKTS